MFWIRSTPNYQSWIRPWVQYIIRILIWIQLNFLTAISFLEMKIILAQHEKKLTLSWRRPLSYRNQSIDLLRKSLDWFLYDIGLRHERVKCNNDCSFLYQIELFLFDFNPIKKYWTSSPHILQIITKSLGMSLKANKCSFEKLPIYLPSYENNMLKISH